MEKKNIIRIINICLVVLSMITIFLFSSENAASSSNTSRGVVKKVVETVMKDEQKAIKVEKKINDNIHIVRKAAHLTEFFILGFLLINLIKDYKTLTKKILLLAIILCLVYACSDELHQFFVAGRAGRYTDILIDTFGSFLGVLSYYLIYLKYKRIKEQP